MSNGGAVGVIIAIGGAVLTFFGVYIAQDWIAELQFFAILVLLDFALAGLPIADILAIFVFIQPELIVQWNIVIYVGIGLMMLGAIIAAAD